MRIPGTTAAEPALREGLAEAQRNIEPPARGSQAIAKTPPRFSSGGVFVLYAISSASNVQVHAAL